MFWNLLIYPIFIRMLLLFFLFFNESSCETVELELIEEIQ